MLVFLVNFMMGSRCRMKESVPLLKVENLSKSFGAIRALHDVSFQLEQGKILGFVGDNGAGKSTLLNILFGRLQPSSGRIYFEGEEVRFKDPSEAMEKGVAIACLLYTSPSPRDRQKSRMPSSA